MVDYPRRTPVTDEAKRDLLVYGNAVEHYGQFDAGPPVVRRLNPLEVFPDLKTLDPDDEWQRIHNQLTALGLDPARLMVSREHWEGMKP